MSAINLNDLLLKCMNADVSDLHLSVGMFPAIRKRGEIIFLANTRRITQQDILDIMSNIVRKEYQQELEKTEIVRLLMRYPEKGVLESVYISREALTL